MVKAFYFYFTMFILTWLAKSRRKCQTHTCGLQYVLVVLMHQCDPASLNNQSLANQLWLYSDACSESHCLHFVYSTLDLSFLILPESLIFLMWSQTKRTNTRFGELARKTFGVLATFASSERVFSKSGILMSLLRSRMSSKTLEMRSFLKSN